MFSISHLRKLPALMTIAYCLTTSLPAAGAESNLSRDLKGRPTSDVLVNGSGPFTFVIDTAAQTSAVGNRLITQMELLPHPKEKAQIYGAAGIAEVPLYPIETMTVGGEKFRDLLIPTLSHVPDSNALGLVGMNLFASRKICFDHHDNRFVVTGSGDNCLTRKQARLPIDLIYGTFAKIKITIDGIAVTAIVDTGAQRSLANRKLMAALELTEASPGLSVETRNEGVTGHATDLVKGFSGAITLGDTELPAMPIEFSDLPVFQTLRVSDGPALILGNDALRQLEAFAIDYGTGEFLYQKGSKK